MKLWTVNRDDQNSERTYFSLLRADGSKFSDGIELPWLNNEVGKSCIPGDVLYLAEYIFSPDHNHGVYEYQNVQGRTACEVHSANIPAQLKGCQAPGAERIPLMQIAGFPAQDGVGDSKATLTRWMTENGIPDYLSHTSYGAVAEFRAAHPDVVSIQIQLNNPLSTAEFAP